MCWLDVSQAIIMTKKHETFKDVYRYFCADCGAEIDGEYDAADDTTTCTSCGKVWKVGEGVVGSGVDNPGQLTGKLFLICPVCHTETDEDVARKGDGEFVCPTCGFMGATEGGLY
jgi:DNA-directed RNA polymerase subunit RPC12/RpoP